MNINREWIRTAILVALLVAGIVYLVIANHWQAQL
jgi:hypothetical protein